MPARPLYALLTAVLVLNLACESSSGMVGAPQTLTVGSSANADYASIQGAINAAPGGSMILVEDGTYVETILIVKSLNLIGSGPGTIVEYPVNGVPDAAVIQIRDTFNVRVAGLRVRSTPPVIDGIRVRRSTGIVIESVVASNNSSDGIDIRESSGIDVIGSTFESNGSDGLQVDEFSSNVRIQGCHAASNLLDGIKFRTSVDGLIENNTSTLNADDGIIVRDAMGVEVRSNTTTNNGGSGIKVADSPDTVLQNNTASGNAGGDIVCEPTACP